MSRLTKVGTATLAASAVMALTLLGLASPALADDAATPDTTSVVAPAADTATPESAPADPEEVVTEENTSAGQEEAAPQEAPAPADTPQEDVAPAPAPAPDTSAPAETVSAPAPEAAPQEQQVAPQNKESETPKKVFVCKYVGTPGVDERLQTGNNPISVAVSSIQNNQWDGSVPGWFSDAHDRSYVISYDTTSNGGGQEGEPTVADCPEPEGPGEPPVVDPLVEVVTVDGVPNCETHTFSQIITTTTTPRHAEWQNGEWVIVNDTPVVTTETSSRPFDAGEYEDYCLNPQPEELDPLIVYGEWQTTPDCEVHTITQTRTVTSTPRTRVWQDGEWVIVLGTPVSLDPQVETRPMEAGEYEDYCVNPEEKVATASFKVNAQPTCTATTLGEFVLVNATLVGEPDLSVGTHHQVAVADEGAWFMDGDGKKNAFFTVDYTIADKLTGDDCKTPPTEEPKQPTPNPVPAGNSSDNGGTLAQTGQNSAQLFGSLGLGVATLLAGLALTLLRRRRA